MRHRSRSDESDDEVMEITAKDCKGLILEKEKSKSKRAKFAPLDVIEIDGDEDLVIIKEVKTENKCKEIVVCTDKNLAKPVKASSRTFEEKEDEIMKKFRLLKRFDTVHDYSDHHYTNLSSISIQAPQKCWAKTIQQEWELLEKDLPDTILVRVYEERMDLLRAGIVGAVGTPYHDGLFFFDFYFPPSYPNVPPQVYYHSGGLCLNPNLYDSGYVCLSLLNTWSGRKEEKWIPRKSTVLQVLLSIQALVLNAKPFFNEPGNVTLASTKKGETQSQSYNEKTFILSCKTMLYALRRPPKNFEDLVVGHFCKHAHDILLACKAYMEGVQVGCLFEGGVQDVEESDNTEKHDSKYFKMQVALTVESLIPAFTQIGAKDCEQFLPKKYKGDSKPPANNFTGFSTSSPPAKVPSNSSSGFPATETKPVFPHCTPPAKFPTKETKPTFPHSTPTAPTKETKPTFPRSTPTAPTKETKPTFPRSTPAANTKIPANNTSGFATTESKPIFPHSTSRTTSTVQSTPIVHNTIPTATIISNLSNFISSITSNLGGFSNTTQPANNFNWDNIQQYTPETDNYNWDNTQQYPATNNYDWYGAEQYTPATKSNNYNYTQSTPSASTSYGYSTPRSKPTVSRSTHVKKESKPVIPHTKLPAINSTRFPAIESKPVIRHIAPQANRFPAIESKPVIIRHTTPQANRFPAIESKPVIRHTTPQANRFPAIESKSIVRYTAPPANTSNVFSVKKESKPIIKKET